MGGHAIMVRVGHPHVMMATMEGPFMIVMVAGVKKLPLDAPSCNYWNLHTCMHDNGDHVQVAYLQEEKKKCSSCLCYHMVRLVFFFFSFNGLAGLK